MAITFLEPGGDATQNVASYFTSGGFWGTVSGGALSTAKTVNGHAHSIQYQSNGYGSYVRSVGGTQSQPSQAFNDTGTRANWYGWYNANPAATHDLFRVQKTGGGAVIFSIQITTAGVIQVWNSTTAQIGSNGTLSLPLQQWFRITVAYTITSTTVNTIKVWINGTLIITVTNATLTNTGSADCQFGNTGNDANWTSNCYTSDHYIEQTTSLTDPGAVVVTSKRPVSNGTTNGFTSTTGSGSGYGSGNAPIVNIRPTTTSDSRNVTTSGSTVTEEFNVEGASVGDANITGATILGFGSWVYFKNSVACFAQTILNGTATSTPSIAINSTTTFFVYKTTSTLYAGTGTDVGLIVPTTAGTYNLYQCGIVVAYIPAVPHPPNVMTGFVARQAVNRASTF